MSWLTFAPGNNISGGQVLSTNTRRSANRAANLLRLSSVNVGQTKTALGGFYRRLAARAGKAKTVRATARKLAVWFYKTLRYGMDYEDPGAASYEERDRQRLLQGLRRRATELGDELSGIPATGSVS